MSIFVRFFSMIYSKIKKYERKKFVDYGGNHCNVFRICRMFF